MVAIQMRSLAIISAKSMYVASLSLCGMTALPEGEGMIQTSTSLNERGQPSGRISWLRRPCGHLGRIGMKRCFH